MRKLLENLFQKQNFSGEIFQGNISERIPVGILGDIQEKFSKGSGKIDQFLGKSLHAFL